jgi:hypothetical protein
MNPVRASRFRLRFVSPRAMLGRAARRRWVTWSLRASSARISRVAWRFAFHRRSQVEHRLDSRVNLSRPRG